MNFKNIILIIILIILVIIGGWWLLVKYKPPVIEEQDEIVTLLKDLETETGIDFSDIEDVEFIWQTKDGEIPVRGKGFEASRISDGEFRSISTFFTKKEFEADVYNIAAGTISGMVGYKEGEIVCHFIGGATGYKEATGQWVPPEPELKDVEIKCGKAEISEEAITTEEAIKKLFAQKYNKKVSAVSLNTTKETTNHARGGVTFLDEEAPGNSGLFLVAKVFGKWQLIFDGQGAISCEEMERYDFPEDMIQDCADILTTPIKAGDTFYIVLESNPTTGFQWDVDFDSDFIELVDSKYIPDSTDPMLVGGGGTDTFEFKALKSDTTEITFSYLRPWEGEESIIEEKVYRIEID